jgi:hypothetical protein
MNFHSEEWAFIRDRIKADIEKQTNALRIAKDLEGLFKAQGAIQALEMLLKLPEKTPK